MFSSAKYPGADQSHDYHSMFAKKSTSLLKKHNNYKMKDRQHFPPTDENINDKHKFYSVKVSSNECGIVLCMYSCLMYVELSYVCGLSFAVCSDYILYTELSYVRGVVLCMRVVFCCM